MNVTGEMLAVTVIPVTPAPVREAILLTPLAAFVTTVTTAAKDATAVGLNLTSNVQVPNAGNEALAHVSDEIANGAPDTETLVIVRFPVPPVLVIVKLVVSELPMATFPKSNEPGEILPVTVTPVTPAPFRAAILLVPSVAFVTTVRIAAEERTAVGLKATPTVHVPNVDKEAPVHVSEIFKNGAAETVALAMIKLPVPPVFVIVNVVVLELPIVTFPKLKDPGEILPVTVTPVTPVPMSDAILFVPSVALVTTVSVAVEVAAAVGLN